MSARTRIIAALSLTLTLLPAAPALGVEPAAAQLTFSMPSIARSRAPMKVSGRMSATPAPGESVLFTMQHRSGGRWSSAKRQSTKARPSGTFAARLKATARGRWRVYASVAATGGHEAATSSPVPFRIVGKKVISLTFDDGPWSTYTDRIVSTLKRYDAPSTFFMLGSRLRGQRVRVKRVIAAGNAVGVHSWDHQVMANRSDGANAADLRRCITAMKSVTGSTPRWFRPPYGSTNARLANVARGLGLSQVLWSIDTLDWRYRTVSSVTSRALRGAKPGAIVLMHDGGGDRSATAAAVPGIIRRLRSRGYDFVTLNERAALGYKTR